MKRLTPATVTLGMLLAVGCLVTAYVAKNLLASAPPAPEATTRLVPMALVDLEPGTEVTELHIGQGPVPLKDMTPDMLISNRAVVGRIVKEPIKAATPLRSAQLYGPGEMPSLALSPGMRAVSVSLGQSVTIVDGLIKPGEYVDVHLTPGTSGTNDPRAIHGGLTMTVFRGVKVLAINRRFQQGNVQLAGNTVTLELTPEQANIMILASAKGDITLTFNPEGKGTGVIGVASEDRATLDEILGLKPLPEPTKPFRSEIYRGATREGLEFVEGQRSNRAGSAIPPASGSTDSPEETAPIQPIPEPNSAGTGPSRARPREIG